jgi:hypothetical protein
MLEIQLESSIFYLYDILESSIFYLYDILDSIYLMKKMLLFYLFVEEEIERRKGTV